MITVEYLSDKITEEYFKWAINTFLSGRDIKLKLKYYTMSVESRNKIEVYNELLKELERPVKFHVKRTVKDFNEVYNLYDGHELVYSMCEKNVAELLKGGRIKNDS